MERWRTGDVVLRREVLNDGRSWMEVPVIVVRDEPTARDVHPDGRAVSLSAGRLADCKRAAPVGRQGTLARPRRAHAPATRTRRTRSGSSGADRSASSAAGTSTCSEPFSRTAARLRHAGPRARHLGPRRRRVAVEGRGAARRPCPRRPLHPRAGRGDSRAGPADRRRARRRAALVGRGLGRPGCPILPGRRLRSLPAGSDVHRGHGRGQTPAMAGRDGRARRPGRAPARAARPPAAAPGAGIRNAATAPTATTAAPTQTAGTHAVDERWPLA